MVTLDVYTGDQLRVNARLRDLETGIRDARAAELAADNRAEVQKSRNRWTVIGLVASPFVAGLVVFIIQGGLAS